MRTKTRKGTVAVSVVVLLCGLGVGAVAYKSKPPKGKVTIDGCKKKKPAVTFDHAAHVKATKKACQTCHHKVDGKLPKHNKCSKCHMKAQGKMGTCQVASKKKNPYHVRCITCHKKGKGPSKCKQCHK